MRCTISVDESEYPGIADWLRRQTNVSAALRELIARHIAGDNQPTAQLDLSGIRAVVDAALDEKLGGLSIAATEPNGDDDLDVFNDLLE